MNARVFVVVLMFLSIKGFSQNGYLGARNSLYIEFYGRPTFEKTHRLNYAETAYKTFNRFAYTSYAIGFSHVASKFLEINFKYRFVKGYAPIHNSIFVKTDSIYQTSGSDAVSITALNFIEDPKVNLHFYSFNLKFYREGSIAPLGKYMGLEFEYGHSRFKTTDDIHVGKGYIAKPNNAFLIKQEIIEKEIIHVPKQLNAQIGGLYLLVGRTYPINDFLLFSCGMKFPIIRMVTVNDYSVTGFRAQKVHSLSYSSTSSFESILNQSLGKQTRISFNLGIKWMF